MLLFNKILVIFQSPAVCPKIVGFSKFFDVALSLEAILLLRSILSEQRASLRLQCDIIECSMYKLVDKDKSREQLLSNNSLVSCTCTPSFFL